MTRTNAPAIRVHVPSLDAAALVQLMERPSDLEPYVRDDGSLGMDDHLDVVADHILEPDLDRDDVEQLNTKDAAALFGHIVQDATNQAAVKPSGWDGGRVDG